MKRQILYSVVVSMLACPLWGQAFKAQPINPGRADYGALKYSQAGSYFSYLMLDVNKKNDERNGNLAKAYSSRKAMEFYIRNVREKISALAGDFPKRTDTKGHIVGTRQCEGFRIEKILFQSLPGRYVTAHLYMPGNGSSPKPSCIEMCGHGLRGKGEFSETAARMALNGIASMVVDPISQGERVQLIDNAGNATTRGVTTEHTLLGAQYNLVGTSLAAQEYWDNSRAIDYLLTRKDIDANRIGCYGFSGGGTQSAYLIALDDRIKVGCIGLFFSNRDRTYETQGPSDGCQWIPGEGHEQIEIADFAMAMAPKPFLNLDGKYDFVDHWGALQGMEELRRCYKLLGAEDKVDDYYAEDGHAVPMDSQKKLITWFRKWLDIKGNNMVLDVPPCTWSYTDMFCTKSGQVNLDYPDALSFSKEVNQTMDNLASSRASFCSQKKDFIAKKMMQLLGIDKFNDKIEVVPTGCALGREIEEYRFQLNCKEQMPVPLVVFIPSTVTDRSPIEIHLHERGKSWYLNDVMKRDAVSNGSIIIAADVRGIGEMEDPYIYNLTKYWNKEYRCAVTSLHLGHPIMGQRVADVRSIVNFCNTDSILRYRAINFVGDGLFGPVLMHAAILDERITSVSLTHTLKSWRSYLENPMQRDMYSNVIEGVLKYYDLPDLVKMSKGRVKIED